MNEIVDQEIEKAMGALFPHGSGRASSARVQHCLGQVAQVAFREGETNALLSLLTVEDVAEKFGVTTRRVRAIARNRHDRFGVGWQVPGTNQWLFRPSEIETLEPNEKYQQK